MLQLKTRISELEGKQRRREEEILTLNVEEVSGLNRIAHVEKDQQIVTLTHKNASLEERVQVLELLLVACRDDMGAKLPHQTKELTLLVPKLQAELQSQTDVVLARDNLIMELRFDKEELKRAASRLQTKNTDLELIAQIGTNATATSNKGKEAELQGVITALQKVAERLKTENENLRKTAIPNSKYMEVGPTQYIHNAITYHHQVAFTHHSDSFPYAWTILTQF